MKKYREDVLNRKKIVEKTKELKPCPFCGCKEIGKYRNGDSFYFFCEDCEASTKNFSFSTNEEKVKRFWNKRT